MDPFGRPYVYVACDNKDAIIGRRNVEGAIETVALLIRTCASRVPYCWTPADYGDRVDSMQKRWSQRLLFDPETGTPTEESQNWEMNYAPTASFKEGQRNLISSYEHRLRPKGYEKNKFLAQLTALNWEDQVKKFPGITHLGIPLILRPMGRLETEEVSDTGSIAEERVDEPDKQDKDNMDQEGPEGANPEVQKAPLHVK